MGRLAPAPVGLGTCAWPLAGGSGHLQAPEPVACDLSDSRIGGRVLVAASPRHHVTTAPRHHGTTAPQDLDTACLLRDGAGTLNRRDRADLGPGHAPKTSSWRRY